MDDVFGMWITVEKLPKTAGDIHIPVYNLLRITNRHAAGGIIDQVPKILFYCERGRCFSDFHNNTDAKRVEKGKFFHIQYSPKVF